MSEEHEGQWKPVTKDLFADPYFRALGVDSNGELFVFWNGGGDWLRQTNMEGESYEEDLCSPIEYRMLRGDEGYK